MTDRRRGWGWGDGQSDTEDIEPCCQRRTFKLREGKRRGRWWGDGE